MSKDTILIVDDERFFCNLLQNILQEKYHTVVAISGEEAIEALSLHDIDLILLDIIMPEMDGFEICKQIKETELYCKIPIIFLSVKSDPEDETRGFNLGAADYITKPISPPVVLARIATQFALSKTSKALEIHAMELEKLVEERTAQLSHEIADKQRAYEKLHFLANYDQLTQLPNRNLFNERLNYAHQLAKRNSTCFSILLIDLDNFKSVNDTLGHHVGDLLLSEIGKRLSSSLREVDTIARLSGDEFTVMLTELHKKEDAAIVAQKVIDILSRPFIIHTQTINIGCSIGITTYPSDGEDIDLLLKNADIAMYDVKNKTKNGYRFFSADSFLPSNHLLELEHGLSKAIKQNELYITYQPIINLKNSKTCAVEALLRWNHPKYGDLSPTKIISAAEQSDLVLRLGEWVLINACQQLEQWRNKGAPRLQMTINMSASQFTQHYNNVDLIIKLIQKYQFPKHTIHFEISENLLIEANGAVLDILFKLKKLGIQFTIDHFGSGYSSLSHLRRFPIDNLKIDSSCINNLTLNLGDDSFVKAVIALGKSLNMKTIAEGVEKKEQLAFLQTHSCDLAQGYFFSKPLAAETMSNLIYDKSLSISP